MSTPVPPQAPVVADPVARKIARANLLRRLANVESAAPRIGRFSVLGKLGEGAHGVVYLAFDPQLDRRVALKLLRHEGHQAQARLLREARALARLSHPHVVAVHEVDKADGAVFVAMEYVEGATLDRWLAQERSAQRVVEVLVGAGRGLLEAHAQGLTHRDFKPGNVMVGVDGRARVTDFGLAHAAQGTERSSGVVGATTTDDRQWAVTQTGTTLGTPAYMAPEQHEEGRADALSDQYSFCLTAWEALMGHHPLATREAPRRLPSLHALCEAKMTGPAHWPSPAASRAVVQALRRGLAADPQSRWPTMEPLLEALAPSGPRGRRWTVGVGGVAVGAAAVVGWSTWGRPEPDLCPDPSARLAETWDDASRTEVEAAFVAVGPSYADAVWGRTRTALDEYAEDWVAMSTETCEATRLHGDQPQAVMNLRMACLQQARVELSAVTRVLAVADADVIKGAHQIIGGLPALSRCEDIDGLEEAVPTPPAAVSDEVERARALLAEAKAEQGAAHFETALQRVEAARDALDGVAYEPVQTDLALREGAVLERLADYEGAETALREALTSASRWQQRSLAFEASTLLVVLVGDRLGKLEQALRYVDVAEGLAGDDPDRQSRLRIDVATVLHRAGRYEEALAQARRAMADTHAGGGPAPEQIATNRALLASFLHARGEYAEAEVEARGAVVGFEELLGAEHPDVGSAAATVGLILVGQGRYVEAEAMFRRALEIFEDGLGPMHVHTATALSNVGLSLVMQGRYAEAKPLFGRALDLYEARVGPEHAEVAQLRYNYAATLQAEGEFEPARDEYQRALELQRRLLGPDHPQIGTTLQGLATTYCELHDLERAEEAYAQALAVSKTALGPEHPHILALRSNRTTCQIDNGTNGPAQEAELRSVLFLREQVLGPHHPDVARSRYEIAASLLRRGRTAAAAQEAEVAWAIYDQQASPSQTRAQTAFLLARALRTLGGDPGRTLSLAERALEDFRALGPSSHEAAQRVTDWITGSPTGR